MVKGYRQIQGIDYDETFSHVAMIKSIRILLALAAHFDYEIWQMDVKIAFLNGNLVEEVYTTQPEGLHLRMIIIKYASLNDPSMDSSKPPKVGIYDLMRQSKNLTSSKM